MTATTLNVFTPRTFGDDAWCALVQFDPVQEQITSRADIVAKFNNDTTNGTHRYEYASGAFAAAEAGAFYPSAGNSGGAPWVADRVPPQTPFVGDSDSAGMLWERWVMLWGYVRNGIDTFDFDSEHPVDRFQGILRDYVHEAGTLPKHVVALLIQEWVRTHSVSDVPKVGTRLRLTDDALTFQYVSHDTGKTVEVVSLTEHSLIVAAVTDDDTLDASRWYLPKVGEHKGWEPLHPTLDDVPEPFEPVDERDAIIATLREQITRGEKRHAEDMAHVSKVFMDQADARNWCEEYDEIVVQKVNPYLHVPMTVREREYEVRGMVTVEIPVVWTITSHSAQAAQEWASEELDENDDDLDFVLDHRVSGADVEIGSLYSITTEQV